MLGPTHLCPRCGAMEELIEAAGDLQARLRAVLPKWITSVEFVSAVNRIGLALERARAAR